MKHFFLLIFVTVFCMIYHVVSIQFELFWLSVYIYSWILSMVSVSGVCRLWDPINILFQMILKSNIFFCFCIRYLSWVESIFLKKAIGTNYFYVTNYVGTYLVIRFKTCMQNNTKKCQAIKCTLLPLLLVLSLGLTSRYIQFSFG